ncbi:3'-5' RNA helicase YTHDC2-like [Lutzomyia longipalpis]|uniref:3'-5' RNA helicase YTHDC2-like n=1 Tax=Lutzomyia longipalpis TaxID=7200 RepID=UPI002483DB8B|nr:3'-5' RNA helicase YTHDC2-like [Lutzomyia longipalpis]
MSNRGGGRRLPAHVTECLRIAIEVELNNFLHSNEMEMSFPSTLTNHDRRFIHEFVRTKGLTSKSHGKTTRVLTVYKPTRNVTRKQKCTFDITKTSRQAIYNLLGALPVSPEEEAEVKTRKTGRTINRNLFNVGTLTNGLVVVPPPGRGNAVKQMRRNLPIFHHRTEILTKITENQVVVIVSETGSGKTTQVPQYLLEDATKMNQPCRIICTQPRRLAALSVADRVAYERGEPLGNTVGYQIRLESQTSPTSNLIYCTNGILVRCLMGGYYTRVFENITHVIVDEVHERDMHSDFLLISLKEAIAVNPHLKVILMSATIDSQLFSQYFDNCAVINVPGRLYEVTNYHLEHVLHMTEYCKKEVERRMQNGREDMRKERAKVSAINGQGDEQEALDEETVKLINESLELCWTQCDDDSFQQFLYLVEGENVPVDFRHTETDMTALMIAAGRGMEEFVEILLQMGANPNVTSSHGMKAIDWAWRLNHATCVTLLEAAAKNAAHPEAKVSDEYTEMLLDTYHAMAPEDDIDQKLLNALIVHIHKQQPPGSILVFLPGYESILRQNEMILDAAQYNAAMSNIRIYMLHSNMKINDQKTVFEPTPQGCRKVILSTNIAETSITIDDVVYVIDCGKVKQTIFDAICGTTALETTWVSQACAKQRAGRAGRVTQGICYKLYSQARYAIMDKFTVPELLRVPLTEICLSAKLIAPQCPIADFLMKALQPPAAVSVRRSVDLLKTMGALDEMENITDLGIHLADLPIDAHLGKMVIYSILLKCVDPVLTVVSALSVRDPFVLPTAARDRSRVFAIKEKFAEKSLSDHMILIRAFQEWLTHSARGPMKRFCEENFLSTGSMMTICGMRSQILGHLRANGLIKSKGKGNIHDLNQNSRHWAVVKACLVAGLYPNICTRDPATNVLRTEGVERVLPHPHGILGAKHPAECKAKIGALPTDWVVFEEKVRVGRSAYINCNSVITPITVALFAGDIHISEEENLHPVERVESDSDRDSPTTMGGGGGAAANEVMFHVNREIAFTLPEETAYLVFHLRQKLNYLLLMLIQNPDTFHLTTNGPHGIVLEAIVAVLMAEEKHYRFPIPEGIGQRPQGVPLEFSSNVNYGIPEVVDRQSSKPIEWNLSDAMRGMTITSSKQGGKQQQREEAASKKKRNVQKKSTKEVPKQQQNKPKGTRYFLIKAVSTEQVKHAISGNEWCFNHTVYNYLQQCLEKNPNVDIMLIFHVSAAQKFFCMGQLVQKKNHYRIVSIHDGSMSFKDVREIVKQLKQTCFMWNDGEELSREMGEVFRKGLAGNLQ